MSVSKRSGTSAIVYVDRPARFWLDGERVLFELSSGKSVICGAMSGSDFIDSFCRAADIAHAWTSQHYSASGVRIPPRASPRRTGATDRSKAIPKLPA